MAVFTGHTCNATGFRGSLPKEERQRDCPACQRQAQAPPESHHSGGASGTRIQTYSGLFVDPLNMTPGELQLPDIAHALGNICRFTGHCSRFYSVAEHSINVALVAQAPTRLETTVRLAALLHDASEAYLNDVARPLKYRPEFKFYRDAEANLQSRIEEKYLGAPTYDHEVHHIVKQADDIMLGIEARDLMWRGAPPDSSAGLDKKEQAKYAAWLDSWPYVKLIPDELYYRVNVAQAPTIGRDGVRREWNPGAEWLRMVEELLVIRGRG